MDPARGEEGWPPCHGSSRGRRRKATPSSIWPGKRSRVATPSSIWPREKGGHPVVDLPGEEEEGHPLSCSVRLSKRWEVRGVREKCIEERRRCVAPGRGCPVWGERGDFFLFLTRWMLGWFFILFFLFYLYLFIIYFFYETTKRTCVHLFIFLLVGKHHIWNILKPFNIYG